MTITLRSSPLRGVGVRGDPRRSLRTALELRWRPPAQPFAITEHVQGKRNVRVERCFSHDLPELTLDTPWTQPVPSSQLMGAVRQDAQCLSYHSKHFSAVFDAPAGHYIL